MWYPAYQRWGHWVLIWHTLPLFWNHLCGDLNLPTTKIAAICRRGRIIQQSDHSSHILSIWFIFTRQDTVLHPLKECNSAKKQEKYGQSGQNLTWSYNWQTWVLNHHNIHSACNKIWVWHVNYTFSQPATYWLNSRVAYTVIGIWEL